MRDSKQYVAVYQFLPSNEIRQSSTHPFLTLQIGDIIELTNSANADWAFGRIFGSTECGLFPLNHTRCLRITDQVEINALNFVNLWLGHTKGVYTNGAYDSEIDHRLNLISSLASTLELTDESSSPKDLFSIVESGCKKLGLGVYLSSDCRQLSVNDYEFNQLLQLVKQKRLDLSGKKNSLSNADDERVYSLLVRINFAFKVPITNIDSGIVLTFMDANNQMPLFESYRICDLVNPDPIYLILRDFNPLLFNTIQLKIDIFTFQLNNLPGFFVDESQHDMLVWKQTIYSTIQCTNQTSRQIDLNLSNDVSTECRFELIGELLDHKNEDLLQEELNERQLKLKCKTLLPLNARPALLASNAKDSISLMFDLSNMPSVEHFDRFQLIAQVVDLHGNVVKDVFPDSNTYSIPVEHMSTRKICLEYFMFGPKDKLKLHLEVNLPRNVNSNVHLRLLFYGSNVDGRLFDNLPIYVAFMRLIDNDALIGMGSTDVFLHKVDSTASLVSLKYLELAGTKRDQKHHPIENESIIPSVHVHISTLCVHFTHNPNVLALLKCGDKGQIIRAIQQLSSISSSSDFSLFLARFLHNIFNKLGSDEELNRIIFEFVNWLLKRSEYPMEAYLKCVIDRELSNLNNPCVHVPFFNLLNSLLIPNNLSQQGTAFWIDKIRGCSSITKIIILSATKSGGKDPNLTNSILQDLKGKFTLLLDNFITNLREMPDHLWIHLRHIPNMLDVLLEYDVFDATSLANVCVELIRTVPEAMQMARIEIICLLTKTNFFKLGYCDTVLLPEFMPIVVEGLKIASEKRENWSKLLNSTVTTLLNILHLLRVKLYETDKVIASDLLFVTSNCLMPIIKCCNASVYDGHEETQMLSQTLFITFIDLIDSKLFAAYVRSFRDESEVSDMLNEFLKALRAFTEISTVQLFNEGPIKLAVDIQCVKYSNFIKCVLFNNRTFSSFQVALWKELMHVLHSYLMNSSNHTVSVYIKEEITLQAMAIECLRSLWFSLSISQKLTLGRNMLESVLDLLSSIQSYQFNSVLLTIFGDIVKAEGYYYSESPNQSFNVYKLLHNKLMKRPANSTNRASLCSEMEGELRSVVLCDQKFTNSKILNMLPRFLKLVNFGREALYRNNSYEISLIYYNLLLFWYEINDKSMIVEYILRLHFFQKSKNELIEAAFCLQNYAVCLSWTNHDSGIPELDTISKRLQLNTNIESEIKEKLYWIICDLFGKAKFWELAIPLLKELCRHYETEKIDYEKLSHVMDRLKEYYYLIATDLRLNTLYFVVGFYGCLQPEYLHNKKFIFRGRQDDRLDTFRQRIAQNFGCELLSSLDDDPEKLAQMNGKFAIIASVQPLPTNEFLRLSNAENPLLSLFYRYNFVDTFMISRPVIKKETKWTEKFGVNDTTKLWIRRTEFKLNQILPGTLPLREVFEERELDMFNPLQTACMNISNSNDELSLYTRLVDHGFGATYLNSLLGQLRGILQAFVGGGVENYKIFLSDAVDEMLIEDGSVADKEKLNCLLIQQLKFLDRGLCVHGRHLNEGSKLLHDSLISGFEKYRQMVQELCGVEYDDSQIRYLQSDEFKSHSPSTSVAYLTNSPDKQTNYNINTTPPLPPRRSNRHSSTLLHNH